MMSKLDGLSLNLEGTNREKLQCVFPECFSEGKLDIDKLLALCGEYTDNDFERYKFEWKGKAACLPLAQKRSTGTLRPCRDESVNFDDTQNLYIEGDNLEVLKLLQTAYYRQVKMIYIDPPYNTGNDFVYEDDFKDPMARYKEVTAQTTKSNPETMGRYHTNWLNMMYPRLRLAANLLRDDGVIFISIDDNEVDNLKKLCNEAFGEENFIAQLIWQRSKKGDAKLISVSHEYVLLYAKSQVHLLENGTKWRKPKQGLDEIFGHYDTLCKIHGSDHAKIQQEMRKWYNSLPDGHPAKASKHYNNSDANGLYFPDNFAGPNDGRTSRPRYDIIHPVTGLPCKKPSTGWRWDEARTLAALKSDPPLIHFGSTHETIPCRKSYLKDVSTESFDSVMYKDGRTATLNVAQLVGKGVFEFPKDADVIQSFIHLATADEDIILDFFSGSATTAHAVMQLNAQDGGNRKFICVQLPEVTDEKSEAYKAEFKNICEIGKERIRRAGAKIRLDIGGSAALDLGLGTLLPDKEAELNESCENKLDIAHNLDIGFKVFKLDTSNFREWDSTPVEGDNLDLFHQRLDNMVDSLKEGRTPMDMVYEVMLKMGIPLDVAVSYIEVNEKVVYVVGDALLLVCLEKNITAEDVEAMAEYAPAKIICAEQSFADDTALSNAHYILRDKQIELKLV